MAYESARRLNDELIAKAVAGRAEQVEVILSIYDAYFRTICTIPIVDITGISHHRFVQEMYIHIRQAVRKYIVDFEYRGR